MQKSRKIITSSYKEYIINWMTDGLMWKSQKTSSSPLELACFAGNHQDYHKEPIDYTIGCGQVGEWVGGVINESVTCHPEGPWATTAGGE